MDRFLFVSMLFSAGAHSLLMAKLPDFGARDAARVCGVEVEIRYVDGDEEAAGAVPSGEEGVRISNEPFVSHNRAPKICQPAHAAPEILQGTGEILRGSVRETLTPLLLQEGNAPEATVEAVDKYKRQLEQILERESNLAYPCAALKKGQRARFVIRFCVRADGALESIDLPSQCGGFDSEIVGGLRRAASHFPPFPGEIKCPRLVFCWPVSFNLY